MSKKTILVVDDNDAVRDTVAAILSIGGYDVIEANSGETALAIVARDKPDVVILDVCMPGMDGVSVLKESLRIQKDLVVIMLTAYSSARDSQNCMDLGAFDYICKPFDNKSFLEKVRTGLKHAESATVGGASSVED